MAYYKYGRELFFYEKSLGTDAFLLRAWNGSAFLCSGDYIYFFLCNWVPDRGVQSVLLLDIPVPPTAGQMSADQYKKIPATEAAGTFYVLFEIKLFLQGQNVSRKYIRTFSGFRRLL